jgi:hypothetical protein
MREQYTGILFIGSITIRVPEPVKGIVYEVTDSVPGLDADANHLPRG